MTVLLVRTIILFVMVIIAVRIMGKRTISELQASELVITLLISDIAAVPMQEIGVPLMSGIIPIMVLAAIEVLVSCVMMKNARFSRLVNGTPVVIIKEGEIDQAALRKLRMTNEDLFEGLRKKSIFDIASVNYAIIETDGSLSILQKVKALPPSAADMGLSLPESKIQALLVSDGDMDEHSMKLTGWSEEKIASAAKKKGVGINDIYMMTGSSDGNYNIIRRKGEKK